MAQEVYVTAYTWEKRSYPKECQKTNLVHSIYMEGDFTVYTFKEGARQMTPIAFKAGETKSLILEWDWQRENITRDWSVTAWGELGEVAVAHEKELKTDSFPYISRAGDSDSTNGNGSQALDIPDVESKPKDALLE